MKEMWNQRFASEEYVYGTQPNLFFKEMITGLKPGKLILPAEGEGRNAVFAAGLGWEVRAMDYSEQGRIKALKLAESMGVQMDYTIGDMAAENFGEEIYDAAALIYAHMPPDMRKPVHRRILKSIKPGGFIILEAFNKDQVRNSSGGPKSIEMLYSSEILADDFAGLEFDIIQEITVSLEQGVFHLGESAIIRMFGRKPGNINP
jgi:hypothetical protein